jgi:hypothetical protein
MAIYTDTVSIAPSNATVTVNCHANYRRSEDPEEGLLSSA